MILNELKEAVDKLLEENPEAGELTVVAWADHGQTQLEVVSVDVREHEEYPEKTIVEIYAP